MRSPTFVPVTFGELRNRDDQHWVNALESLRVPNIDHPSPVVSRLPYAAVYREYLGHLESCGTCGEGVMWEQCPEGDRLSGLAADAMAAQEDLAGQN